MVLAQSAGAVEYTDCFSDEFKNVISKMCLEVIYLTYMHKKDLELNRKVSDN